jgi:5,10-methylenetetrahydromethanopterin reductase
MTLHRIEAEITPGMSAREAVELARLVEQVGFDRLGISDVVFWPDCFVLLGLAAQATQRLHVGPMVTNPSSRHPVVLAGIMATLHDVSQGRAFLGLGVGAGLEGLDLDLGRPVVRLREAITVIRGLLAGEEVTLHGETITVSASRMVGPVSPVPISIGTRSPKVMRLAGELADIALVGGRYLSPAIAATYRQWLAEGAAAAGRDLATLEVAPRLTLCCSHDGALARRSVKRYVAHYVNLMKPAELDLDPAWLARVAAALARSRGWYFDHDRYDDPDLDDLIDDELVRSFAIAGTPQECLALTREVLDQGFTSVSMNLAFPIRDSMATGLRETLEGFGEVLSALRQA